MSDICSNRCVDISEVVPYALEQTFAAQAFEGRNR